MNIIKELEFRRNLLLDYYETTRHSDKMEDRLELEPEISWLWYLSVEINKIKEDKSKYLDNTTLMDETFTSFDKTWSHIK